jgi:ATP-binding cassette, subfamily C (CFTR/MRP), member 1
MAPERLSRDAQRDAVVHNVSLEVRPGQRVGICGASGSGKSTVLASLFRLAELVQGEITIDGIDITTLPRQKVREGLNIIPQDPIFLKGTVRENLDLHNKCDVAQLEGVLREVGLWEIVQATPSGLESELDATELLSHGQRQLFCLARAILRPSKIVILDEVTSSVDPSTDKIMQTLIRRKFKDSTIIAVAHRLHTVADFDQIYVLQAGRIVESGKPAQLLKQQGGAFRRLWES